MGKELKKEQKIIGKLGGSIDDEIEKLKLIHDRLTKQLKSKEEAKTQLEENFQKDQAKRNDFKHKMIMQQQNDIKEKFQTGYDPECKGPNKQDFRQEHQCEYFKREISASGQKPGADEWRKLKEYHPDKVKKIKEKFNDLKNWNSKYL